MSLTTNSVKILIEALEKIAGCGCEIKNAIGVSECVPPHLCVTCIAREALLNVRKGEILSAFESSLELPKTVTREELDESLDLMLSQATRESVILPSQVQTTALQCFVDKRDDIHSERVRLAAKSLRDRGLLPWVKDEDQK